MEGICSIARILFRWQLFNNNRVDLKRQTIKTLNPPFIDLETPKTAVAPRRIIIKKEHENIERMS